MISSTGVPPTGRSSAAANFFSGFHRAKWFTAGYPEPQVLPFPLPTFCVDEAIVVVRSDTTRYED